MTTPAAITSQIQKLAPTAMIELFELDATSLGGEVTRFHAGTNQVLQDIVWQGETYFKFPIIASGFEFSVNSQLPRPKLAVSNVLGTITALLLAYRDLLGAKVTRKRTLAKYLDAVNFEGGVNADEDQTAEFPDEIFFIDRKVTENRDVVEFELASPIDLAGVKLPRRQIIQNLCPWVYRSSECGYAAARYFDTSDTPVSSLAQDVCGKRLASCRVRFGNNKTLPFGGFPSVGTFR